MRRGWLVAVGFSGVIAGTALTFSSPNRPSSPSPEPVPSAGIAYPSASPVRATPRHLSTDYVAPRGGYEAAGVLEIPSLGVRAPVLKVGLDGQTMAIPNDPSRIGWLDSSASAFDLVGVSLLSGHVSNRSDEPGVLGALTRIADDAEVTWTSAGGGSVTFRVTGTATYPRTNGVPPDVVARDGRHRLALVTCTDRVEAGGHFRYTSNLVVTAVEVSRSRP